MATQNLGNVRALIVSATAPTNTNVLWRNTSASPETVNLYNSVSGIWEPIAMASGGEDNTASNVGSGEGLFAQKVGVDLQFKSLVEGTNITLNADASSVTISSTDMGEANTASNLGSGTAIFAQKSGVDFQFKSLVGGTNVNLGSDTNSITINSTDTGEANTASNLGSGTAIFAQKSGVDFQFKSLVGGTNVNLGSDTNSVTVNVPAAAGLDTSAIHDNVANEIAAISQKSTPVGGDVVLIEDSEDGNNKKYVTASTLMTGAGGITDAPNDSFIYVRRNQAWQNYALNPTFSRFITIETTDDTTAINAKIEAEPANLSGGTLLIRFRAGSNYSLSNLGVNGIDLRKFSNGYVNIRTTSAGTRANVSKTDTVNSIMTLPGSCLVVVEDINFAFTAANVSNMFLTGNGDGQIQFRNCNLNTGTSTASYIGLTTRFLSFSNVQFTSPVGNSQSIVFADTANGFSNVNFSNCTAGTVPPRFGVTSDESGIVNVIGTTAFVTNIVNPLSTNWVFNVFGNTTITRQRSNLTVSAATLIINWNNQNELFTPSTVTISTNAMVLFTNTSNAELALLVLNITGAQRILSFNTSAIMQSNESRWSSLSRQLTLAVGIYKLTISRSGTAFLMECSDNYQ